MAYMKMKLIEGSICIGNSMICSVSNQSNQSNCSNFSCSSINLELTNWITHIKAHSLQSLMHPYFLWKRPKATQFDLGFFITLDRPYRHSISVSKMVLFGHLRFYVQYLRGLSWEEAVTHKV